jgi:protein TonB
MRKPALLLSAGFHAAAIGLLLLAAALAPRALPPPHRIVVELEPLPPPPPVRPAEGGGAGDSKLLARDGQPPERARTRVFVAPSVEPREDPQLAIQPAVLEAPQIHVAMTALGSPFGVPDGGDGLGVRLAGPGNGGGDGAGGGPGGFGSSGTGLRSRITRQPEVIHKEEPEYSDEARKAHWEGVVVIRIDVDVDGRPTNIQVVRSVGLGLDEKAVEAVRNWRFRPALAGNQPVVAPAMIEVGFRLL